MTSLPYSGQTALGATLPGPAHAEPSPASLGASGTIERATTLPRIEGDGAELRLVPDSKARYEPLKLLGAGGMGEVVLVQDNDIARKVAVKRLRAESGAPSVLARFVDEVRTVGRLEHPSIVPIHDVGVDEQGRYYFVMKYVEGETLESIIEKLAARDPSYQSKYTFERRAEIFGALLHALAYAHANGVVHRDVKPANVMVGRYGEVMLMDWGVAKPVTSERDLAAGAEATVGEQDGGEGRERDRLYATRIGALVGTPAYMSPEQARGENDRIDARSDLYAAAVLLYELLTTHHYLEGKTTVEAMIMAVIREELPYRKMHELLDPAQPRPPAELLYLAAGGMAKDPAKRFQSADEMLATLQRITEGRMQVYCHVTFMKRILREAARLVDRHSGLASLVLLLLATFVALGVIHLARLAMA